MTIENFEQLRKKRLEWVQINKENEFEHIENLLGGIYNDPSHFIYEILQNAEDAQATEIIFKLQKDELIVKHNGKDFTFEDVKGVTGVGLSTKKDDVNTIGKFGVGFKSVFAITTTPIIHSGKFHFKIEDFVVPEIIESKISQNTTFVFPFSHHQARTEKEIYELIRKKLERIGLKTLLFLKNIVEIKWQTLDKSGHYYKEVTDIRRLKNVQRVTIISKTGQEEEFEEFLVIRKPVVVETHELNIEVAYRIGVNDAGEEIIEKEKDSRLIVFFPTEKVTYLNFLIQAPYKTTPNRENIPLDDEQNKYLIEETANLVAESISIVKDLGLMSISFLEVLPIDTNHTDETIYSSIFKKVKEKLLSEEALLPTWKKNFTTARDAVLAQKELTTLLDESDLKILFEKLHWLDTGITYRRTRQLYDYIIRELDIPQINFEDFAVAIKEELIMKKPDTWLIEFYSTLLDKRYLWAETTYYKRNAGILKTKPIIRLSDNTHIAPYNKENKIQVYLPANAKTKYKTVKETLTQNEKSLKFLTELGLSKPDIFAEIKEFIVPKYKETAPDIDIEEYFEDFEKLLIAFKKEDSGKKKEMVNELKGLYIIYSENSTTGEYRFCKPSETYLKTEALAEYFKGFDYVFFVSDKLKTRLDGEDGTLTKFLLAIGCEDKPRRIRVTSTLTSEEKRKLRESSQYNGLTDEIDEYDYDYEGIDNFLKELTEKRSCILWNFLLKSLDNCSEHPKRNFFMGEYKWKYYRENTARFEARFLKTLKNTPWLFSADGNQYLPNQISLSKLSDSFYRDNENVKTLTTVLGFQIDAIKQIEEQTGKKVILLAPEEELEFSRWKAQRAKKSQEETERISWLPKVEPESVEPFVEEVEPEKLNTPDLRGQRAFETTSKNYNGFKRDTQKISKQQLKEIGNWGERFVFHHLKKQFENESDIEVIWLNKNRDSGKGYDILIISHGEETDYIEVKSKLDNNPYLVEISGTQWEFARKLHNENEGDKYKIYVVSHVGTNDAKIKIIKNPVKLWKEGRLYAHPVRLKL